METKIEVGMMNAMCHECNEEPERSHCPHKPVCMPIISTKERCGFREFDCPYLNRMQSPLCMKFKIFLLYAIKGRRQRLPECKRDYPGAHKGDGK